MGGRLTRVIGALACAGFCALSAACGGEEVVQPVAEEVDAYVGAVSGSDAVFAVHAGDVEVVLYVCGGPGSFESSSRWYRGPRVEGSDEVALTSADGGSAIVRFAAGHVEGEAVEPDGTRLSLEADAVAEGTIAGLYGVMDEGCRTGVVVMQDEPGDEPRVQGTWCSDEGIYAQVTPIAPLIDPDQAFAERGIPVKVLTEVPEPEKRLVARYIDPAFF